MSRVWRGFTGSLREVLVGVEARGAIRPSRAALFAAQLEAMGHVQ
jgi:hypothetical protein